MTVLQSSAAARFSPSARPRPLASVGAPDYAEGMTCPPPDRPSATRRQLLAGLGTAPLAASALLAAPPAHAESRKPADVPQQPQEPPARTLIAGPAKARLRPAPAPESEIWAFDGATPVPTAAALAKNSSIPIIAFAPVRARKR